jgi:NAD(P)-dependent dehydrogenase (short-subunit alcohol dehydrogenase family)
MKLLEDKVAIITGAGRGIGEHTARLFAEHGAAVVVNDAGTGADGSPLGEAVAERVATEIVESGGKAVASTHSVCDRTQVQSLFELATERFGGVDILINSAGFLRDRSLLRMSDEDFDEVVSVHLKGTFLCCQAAASAMKARGGSIVNTTGVAGLLGNFGQVNASAAQAAVYGLTRTASVELQRFGIRVNAVAPLAKTRLTAELPMFEHVDSMSPKHVAPVHLFLASELSGQTTGSIVSVAGGRLSVYRMVESAGEFKEAEGGVWDAREIAEHFSAIRKA